MVAKYISALDACLSAWLRGQGRVRFAAVCGQLPPPAHEELQADLLVLINHHLTHAFEVIEDPRAVGFIDDRFWNVIDR